MKLSTTMGIELTYVPDILQKLSDDFPALDASDYPFSNWEDNINEVKAQDFRKILKNKGILKEFTKVHNDPGVVEAPTKPKKTLEGLLSVAEKAAQAARVVGMKPTQPYSTGGGAHIHMELPRGGLHSNYIKELTNLVAKYPVMSWAFVSLNDDINAKPITVADVNPFDTDEWHGPFFRLTKDDALRFTTYGSSGTAELRFFEMGDANKLKRNIKFADAVNKRAVAMAKTSGPHELSAEAIPSLAALLRLTKKQALQQFDTMLAELGLRKQDYKAERLHLGKRMDLMKKKEVGI